MIAAGVRILVDGVGEGWNPKGLAYVVITVDPLLLLQSSTRLLNPVTGEELRQYSYKENLPYFFIYDYIKNFSFESVTVSYRLKAYYSTAFPLQYGYCHYETHLSTGKI